MIVIPIGLGLSNGYFVSNAKVQGKDMTSILNLTYKIFGRWQRRRTPDVVNMHIKEFFEDVGIHDNWLVSLANMQYIINAIFVNITLQKNPTLSL